MNRKEWILVALVLVLGGVYAICFSNWFRPKVMHIEHSARSLRDAYGSGGQRIDPTGKQQLGNVTFGLHGNWELTSVKVVLAEDARTNKYPHAIWHLVSEDGSERVKGLCYGLPVPGMEPASVVVEPEPLKPGVEYRLLVEASSTRAEHDFTLPRPRRTR